MIVVVTGGRDFNNKNLIFQVLDNFHQQTPIRLLIHGNARGVDKLCGLWSLNNEINTLIMPAKWSKYQYSAGPLRNEEMVNSPYGIEPNVLISFPGGKGTEHMTKYCTDKGIEVKLPKDIL